MNKNQKSGGPTSPASGTSLSTLTPKESGVSTGAVQVKAGAPTENRNKKS